MTPKKAFSKLFKSSGKVLGFDEVYVPINFVGKPKGLRDKLCKQVDTALTRLEELEQEVIDRQETEDSLTKWVNELTDKLKELEEKITNYKNMLISQIKTNNELLKGGHFMRVVYENNLLNQWLLLLDWSDEE